ncbi:MAG: hypothetical protein IJF54_03425 [Clostridia bacterium]|nr:hypothetical protein [Clostridia bacterium]
MKKKMKIRNLTAIKAVKALCSALCVFSVVFMMFTAGASDMELLTLSQTVLRTMIGIWMLLIGMFGHRVCYVSIIKQRRRIVADMKNNHLRGGEQIKSVA